MPFAGAAPQHHMYMLTLELQQPLTSSRDRETLLGAAFGKTLKYKFALRLHVRAATQYNGEHSQRLVTLESDVRSSGPPISSEFIVDHSIEWVS